MLEIGSGSKNLDISWGAIIKIAFAVILIYTLYMARDVLLITFFGLVISMLFNPAINLLQKMKISRVIASSFVYFITLGIMGTAIYLVSPVFMVEMQQLAQRFPTYFERVAPSLSGLGFDIFQSMDAFIAALRDWLVGASSSIVGSIASIFGGVMLTATVFTIAFFFSLEEKGLEKFIMLVIPKKHEKYALDIWNKSQIKISGWFVIRFVGMVAVGLLTSMSCYAVGIQYPVFLGFIAGVLDIIPFIGPLAAGLILGMFALLDSWQKAVLIIMIFTFVQQLENNLIIPLLTRKFMDFPGILVLISIFIGETLWGVAGAILAIPLFGVMYDVVRDYLEEHKD